MLVHVQSDGPGKKPVTCDSTFNGFTRLYLVS